MRVYADDSVEIVLRPGFLDVHERGGTSRQVPWEPPPKRGSGIGFARRRVLAVAGRSIWLGEGRSVRVAPLDTADFRAVEPLGVRILDAVGVDDERVLACVCLDGEAGACLRVVSAEAPAFEATTPLSLPEARAIEWPKGAIWKAGKEAWPAADTGALASGAIAPGYPQKDGARFFDAVQLTRSAWGVAGASVQSGLVFALSPDGDRVEAALRVPSLPEAELHPIRTREGVLVVVCVEGQLSAILHLALDGTVLAARSKVGRAAAKGMGPPLLLGERVFVFERGSGALLELDPATLEVLEKHAFPPFGGGQAGASCHRGAALVSDGEAAFRVALGGEGDGADLMARALDALGADAGAGGDAGDEGDEAAERKPKKLAKPAKPTKPARTKSAKEAPSEPPAAPEEAAPLGEEAEGEPDGVEDEDDEDGESDDEELLGGARPNLAALAALLVSPTHPRATGAPSLVLAEAATPSRWVTPKGARLEVTVGFGNAGGASRGVYLEVSGPALGARLVTASEVQIESTRVAFEKKGANLRAELPALSLLAGLLADPKDKRSKLPPYDGVHRARITLEGLGEGTGLLMIRVGPLAASPGRGSIVQGKTLVVSG